MQTEIILLCVGSAAVLLILILLALRRRRDEPPMSGADFEQYAAELLENAGYPVLEVTKASGDFGADIIILLDGERTAVQCKRYSKSVGVSAVQEAAASKAHYRCKNAAVLTDSSFTVPAKTLAAELGVLLWDGEELTRLQEKGADKNAVLTLAAVVVVAPVVAESCLVARLLLDGETLSDGEFAEPLELNLPLGDHELTLISHRKKQRVFFTLDCTDRRLFVVGELGRKAFLYEVCV